MLGRLRKNPESDEDIKERLIGVGQLSENTGHKVADLAVRAYRAPDELGKESGMGAVLGAHSETPMPDMTTTEADRAVLDRLNNMTIAGVRAYSEGLRGADVLRAMDATHRQDQIDFPTEF
jgi:hypothetical protein